MDNENPTFTTRIINMFYRNDASFIAALLVGNNTALVIYGIMMASVLGRIMFGPLGIESEAMQLTIKTFISTAIVLVTGEFLPKTLFRINPNRMLHIFAVPMWLCYVILYPISKLSSAISKSFLFLFGIKNNSENYNKQFTRVDLDNLIQTTIDNASDEDEVNDEVEMFQNVLDFSQAKVRDCLLPRTEIVAVEKSTSLEELLSVFIESGHSKIVVYEGDIDNIVGFIHSVEMFHNPADWTKQIKEIPIVPETMSAQKLFKIFTTQKKSLAVVVDEFGGTSGIVSLEDLVEEIFGEIEDEHDRDDLICKKIGNNEYIISARVEIDRANDTLNLELPESDDYMTVGGLILSVYQSLPKPNTVIRISDRYEFRIIKVSMTKIELVKLIANN